MNQYVYHDGYGSLITVSLARARVLVEKGVMVYELVPVEAGDLDLIEIDDEEG